MKTTLIDDLRHSLPLGVEAGEAPGQAPIDQPSPLNAEPLRSMADQDPDVGLDDPFGEITSIETPILSDDDVPFDQPISIETSDLSAADAPFSDTTATAPPQVEDQVEVTNLDEVSQPIVEPWIDELVDDYESDDDMGVLFDEETDPALDFDVLD